MSPTAHVPIADLLKEEEEEEGAEAVAEKAE